MKTQQQPLTKVPLVNGNGQHLEICPKCHGTTYQYEAKRYKPGTLFEEGMNICKAQENQFKKDGWTVNVRKCLHCKGAGMVLSEQTNVW